MPAFRFEAVTSDDERQSGMIEAASAQEAIAELQRRGLIPLRVSEGLGGFLATLATTEVTIGRRIKPEVVANFVQQLGHLIQAGVDISISLDILRSAEPSKPLRAGLEEVQTAIRSGKPLSAALEGSKTLAHAEVIAVVRAAESSGTLGPVLVQMGQTLRIRIETSRRLITALIYPACLCVALIGTIVVLLTQVVPTLETLTAGAEHRMPASTRFLIGFGKGLSDYGLHLGLGFVGLMLVLFLMARNREGRMMLERRLLGLPLIGTLLSDVEAARLLRVLHSLIESGLTAGKALPFLVEASRLLVVKSALQDAVAGIRQGERLQAALGRLPAISSRALALIRVGESTGRLAPMLSEAARLSEEQVTVRTERFMALLTPVVTLVLGLIAGFVLYSVFSAILSVNDLALG